jgi:hypothetical protein
MTARAPFLALFAPCFLAACVNETVIPEATTTSNRAAAAAAASSQPSALVTAFDGRYVGKFTLNPDRTRACPPAPNEERGITVRQGRATLLIDPPTRHVLTGTVGPAGDVRMADSLDRTIATTGVFDNGRFQGEHRNGLCSYAVSMTKRD